MWEVKVYEGNLYYVFIRPEMNRKGEKLWAIEQEIKGNRRFSMTGNGYFFTLFYFVREMRKTIRIFHKRMIR